ncbi:MAG: nuclear transport factor 2 family protein [Acidimicrobiia bacterium]
MLTPPEQDLQKLFDEQAIARLEPLCCRAVDRLDAELLRSLFHPDGVEQRGGDPVPVHAAADAIMDGLRGLFISTHHTVTQAVIDIDGDDASSESYYLSTVIASGGPDSIERVFGDRYAADAERAGTIDRPHEIRTGGRYLSRYTRHGGRWVFVHRLVVVEWNRCEVSLGHYDGGLLCGLNRSGTRDRTDPVYRLR